MSDSSNDTLPGPIPLRWDTDYAKECCERFKQGKLQRFRCELHDPTEHFKPIELYNTPFIYFINSKVKVGLVCFNFFLFIMFIFSF